ncbi:MAG: class I SAM-dependent methyltransferase [Candidatus Kapaibacteriales bacterium]
MEDYIKYNKQSWNDKVEPHFNSEFYDVNGFLNGESSLNDIELKLLGDVCGKSILHLQCHFGLDSLSLARMGAKVTAVDFSENAIEKANELKEKTGLDVDFICSNVLDLKEHLMGQFDIVYVTYGTIGWLSDLDKWASIVSYFLKPSGKLVFVEFHPVIWMFDDDIDKISYSYFRDEAIEEEYEGTYADRDAGIKQKTISWNQGIGEVAQSLKKNGVAIDDLQEYDFSPYACFRNLRKDGERVYRFSHIKPIPMVYSIVGVKK